MTSHSDQVTNLLSLSTGIAQETQNAWIKQVKDWEQDLSKPDPYYVQRQGVCGCYWASFH